MPDPLLLSPTEAARELGIGRDKTYTLIREGRLKAIRFGRVLKVPRAELNAFIEQELEVQSAGAL